MNNILSSLLNTVTSKVLAKKKTNTLIATSGLVPLVDIVSSLNTGGDPVIGSWIVGFFNELGISFFDGRPILTEVVVYFLSAILARLLSKEKKPTDDDADKAGV